MKFWNELDKNIFFEKLFSSPIEIREIAKISLQLDNDRPSLGIGFDIPEFPDNLPEKWKNKGYNVCRLGIDCYGISNLKILNIPNQGVFSIKIKKEGDHFRLQATNKNSSLELNAKNIFLCDPNAYKKDNN
ncbi:hypothetical protein H0Z09_27105 [Pseudomonas sp. SWRI18]|uniref:Imm50 family immunity protein n=1 Tax=Pseudomonas sp. SWRI18 TaxID=2753888 RepID=UPI0016471A0B|nr:Imm50 family immunity protein [Pseudomonas sp. SWRI18]MBC3304808.1 hypothetical protein [Pseudomonas sp. SWRI18]